MRTAFAGMTELQRTIDLPDGMQIPASNLGMTVGEGTLLFVRADGTFVLDDQPVATVEAVTKLLVEQLAQMNDELNGPPDPRFAPQAESQFALVMLLVIDARAPLTHVVALIEALPKQTNYWQVVDLAGTAAGPAGPAWADETLIAARALPPPERATKLAPAIERAIGGCQALQDDFALIATAEPDSRRVLLADALPSSVEKCRCEGVDVEALMTIVWTTAGGQSVRKRKLPLVFAREPTAEALNLPSTANGADLAREAAARGMRPFRLQLGDP